MLMFVPSTHPRIREALPECLIPARDIRGRGYREHSYPSVFRRRLRLGHERRAVATETHLSVIEGVKA